ncbi:uncharacterized protein LOC131953418 [Physella acuta]|uniref:uncharacterized protein LOC131953418 n=1 Tax=Physella acuta TaxID=109671 RepID=UPI0027DD8AE9|nr:uncharacterized protein LOC131953418 [Physella acuta]XP_059172571.1 uncharacterized protein LOC131953418 [Physella acuta]
MNPLLIIALLVPMTLAQLGGFEPMHFLDGSDPNVQFAVKAINDFYAKQGDNAVRTFVSVLQSQSQIVAGTHYQFTLKVATATQTEICQVDVWSRPWLSGSEGLQTTKDPVCTPQAKRQVLVGGPMVIDSNRDDVQKALDFAVTTMNAQENYLYLRKAVSIAQVTSQVVSGISFHFTGVVMASTNCDKSTTHNLNGCAVANDADTRTCDFNVWWQSWMTPEYQLTNVHCN